MGLSSLCVVYSLGSAWLPRCARWSTHPARRSGRACSGRHQAQLRAGPSCSPNAELSLWETLNDHLVIFHTNRRGNPQMTTAHFVCVDIDAHSQGGLLFLQVFPSGAFKKKRYKPLLQPAALVNQSYSFINAWFATRSPLLETA